MLKYLALLLVFISFSTWAYEEPPFLTVKEFVNYGANSNLVLKSTSNETVIINPRLQNQLLSLQIRNDAKTKKGAMLLSVGGKLVRFHFAQKIELDADRLPFWLDAISAASGVTKQEYGASIIKTEVGEKYERMMMLNRQCSETVWREICRWINVSPPGLPPRFIRQCRSEPHTVYGDQQVQVNRITSVDGYEAALYDGMNTKLIGMKFDIPKKEDRIISVGICRVPYYPDPYNPGPYYPHY